MTVQQHSRFVFSYHSKLFLVFQRTLCSDKKSKNVVGRVIQDLNKENKSLFGELWETRKERRKTLQSISYSSSNSSIYNNIEANSKSNKKTRAKSKLASTLTPRFEKRVIKASNVDNRENYPQDFDKSDINVRDDKGSESQSYRIKTEVNESRDESSGYANDIEVKTGVDNGNILPPIVIKNIFNFPMINRNKKVETYSLEKFDSLSITNKQLWKMYPSVSKVLNSTMSEHSKMLLKKWRERMVLEMGEEGFMKFYKAQLNAGVQFHTAVQSFLRGTPAEKLVLDGQGVDGSWRSLESVMPDVDEVQVIEGPVHHSDLLYHGVMDCVAIYQGEAVLIEWKKSDKPKPTLEKTYDAPVQLSAYLGAMNYDWNYPIQVKGGLVVVAYSDGSPADTFHLELSECFKYWKIWLQRLQSFWLQQYQGQSASIKAQVSN